MLALSVGCVPRGLTALKLEKIDLGRYMRNSACRKSLVSQHTMSRPENVCTRRRVKLVRQVQTIVRGIAAEQEHEKSAHNSPSPVDINFMQTPKFGLLSVFIGIDRRLRLWRESKAGVPGTSRTLDCVPSKAFKPGIFRTSSISTHEHVSCGVLCHHFVRVERFRRVLFVYRGGCHEAVSTVIAAWIEKYSTHHFRREYVIFSACKETTRV